ncbi:MULTISPECIES: adenine deaminase [Carboxydothermus]|uniref:Adenine deaminase 2 n=2 Tax=Carboxydothermus TaxID=129957 RepID=ADEC2_CARHZ|nr:MULTISPECIES: adenine deaminase [Carboxydothermus]Q3AE81.1 RecName: Full=Adenine deaminase 2; Short=Adenase 2; Short=Adenine aminase 2 [Carboxydothermus hydrogenoformans Z-2901]ABB15047.1 adenine deaminase [Carboxydothermus hydrogenoformans Z-2901]NYE56567.1 adenine deaminase [Carboxydothermus ferrireducens DSM 11255]
MKPIKDLVEVALGKKPADLVLKNAQVFNSFTGEFVTGDVAVVAGYIAGTGEYEGKTTYDLQGAYVTPGFIDGHVHIESSMVAPAEFARALVPAGTLTAVVDPHEIANVSGTAGIRYMLEASSNLPINIYLMLPSCVPATSLETAGAVLTARELSEFINHPRVLGLGELMDYPGVLNTHEEMLKKLAVTEGKLIDGHAPGISGKELTAYIAAGVNSEHECTTAEEARERLSRGMYLMLREGSATKNLLDLLPAVDRYTASRCFFVTDDRHPEDLIKLGSINHMVKLAVSAGADLPTVLQMATINAANYFRLYDLGAIAPGYRADILVFEDLQEFKPKYVFKDGKLVAENGKPLFTGYPVDDRAVRNTMRLKEINPEKLKIPAKSNRARVIGLIPHQIVTKKLELEVPVEGGYFKTSTEKDIAKLAVFERHNYTGNVGVGLIHGLGLKKGAIASTVAHDSHNLVVAGMSDEDIIAAVEELKRIGGGLTVVADGQVLGSLPLPIAGLMSDRTLYEVQEELEKLHRIVRNLGVSENYDPFMTLAFLSLPVIPELKLTDLGLVDVSTFSVVPVSL